MEIHIDQIVSSDKCPHQAFIYSSECDYPAVRKISIWIPDNDSRLYINAIERY
jgi:hypothetical protein